MDGDEQFAALGKLLDLTERSGIYREEQCRRLALTWPSLAAGLAELLVAHGRPVPRALHVAAVVAREVNCNSREAMNDE